MKDTSVSRKTLFVRLTALLLMWGGLMALPAGFCGSLDRAIGQVCLERSESTCCCGGTQECSQGLKGDCCAPSERTDMVTPAAKLAPVDPDYLPTAGKLIDLRACQPSFDPSALARAADCVKPAKIYLLKRSLLI